VTSGTTLGFSSNYTFTVNICKNNVTC